MPEKSEDKAILEFRDASISNGEINVIEDFTFRLERGEFVYLTGRVGSGKTSIIRTIIGDVPLAGGSGRIGEFDLASLKQSRIASLRRNIGIVFQDFQLLMDRSVEENLRFVLKATDWKKSAAIEARIRDVLEAVGMSTKGHKMPHQLSGGEQQRVAIARALLNSPGLILADEPTGNLDADTAREIMNLLLSINRIRHTAILMVTHNRQILHDYPARTLVCEDNLCREAL